MSAVAKLGVGKRQIRVEWAEFNGSISDQDLISKLEILDYDSSRIILKEGWMTVDRLLWCKRLQIQIKQSDAKELASFVQPIYITMM
jgi:hypothetical protein